MTNLQRLILSDHPKIIFIGSAFVLSLISLTSTPSFWPMALLLSNLQLYMQTILRRNGFVPRLLILWFFISLAGTLANFSTAMHALSTPFGSLITMALMSTFESMFALLIVYLDSKYSGRMKTPWAQILLFPTLWATFWSIGARFSPVGRLLMWSPVQGFERYEWIARVAGPSGIDWAVAACAVVVTQIFGAWLMGPNTGQDSEQERIIDVDNDENPPKTPPPSDSHRVLYLATLLALLTLPSFFNNGVPLSPSSVDTTPLTVGCVLPSSIYDKNQTTALDDYLDISKKMTSAQIIIWPEGAVKFDNPEEREAGFEKINSQMSGTFVGVSFEEFVPTQAGGRVGMRRNGFALIAPLNHTETIVQMEYYKRNLVPIAESYSLTPSLDPPSIYSLDLRSPRGVAKTKWAPAPDYIRPIPITASICLDFASPSAFLALQSRPALILAPARTWHIGVGLAMWEQAKARAAEIGSTVLWCDGGEGGVSGVAGGNVHFMQVGEGSWTRTIGIQWPFNENRTIYSRWGNTYTLWILWLLLGTGWAGEKIVDKNLGFHSIIDGIRRIFKGVREWKERRELERRREREPELLLG